MSADRLLDRTPDSILDGREREKRFRAESERLQAEQAAQERHQRDRQARHQEAARRGDEETRAALFLRVMRAQEEAKPLEPPPPVPVYTERQDTELAAEQAAGRRALAKYAQREEKAKEGTPGFKAT